MSFYPFPILALIAFGTNICLRRHFCLMLHYLSIYFRDDDRINSFKNCNPFSTECLMRILKYMFAAELFSVLPVVGICHLLKVVLQMSFTQFLRRKQEVQCVKISYLQFCSCYILWYSSRRASAQAVTSKWQLRTTSPMNTNSSAGENGFSAKNGS